MLSNKSRKISYNLCSWLVAAAFYLQFFISFVVGKYIRLDSETVTDVIYILLTQIVAVGVPCALGFAIRRADFKATFKTNALTQKQGAMCVLLGAFSQPVAILINIPLSIFVQSIKGEQLSVISRPPSDLAEVMMMVLVVGLVPAFFEEFLVRGLVLDSVYKYGTFSAMVVSSLAFALLHNDFSSFLGHLLIGMILAYVVLMTGSVLAAVIVHFSFNVCGVFLDYFMNIYTELSGVGFLALVAVLGLGVIFFAIYQIYDVRTMESIEDNAIYRPPLSFLNIPTVLLLVGYVFKNFLY